MAAEVKLPRLGQGMESGTIVKWLKAEGERVEKGEPLYELDTEKVTQEVEAEAEGVLLRIAVREGEVPVGQTIAFIGQPGEQVAVEGTVTGTVSGTVTGTVSGTVPRGEVAAPRAPAPVITATATQTDGRLKASPLARRIARERGVDLAALAGTGPEGRIVAEDVERVSLVPAPQPAAPLTTLPPGEVEQIPLTSIRRTIARRLTEAWQVPVFQLQVSADMERVSDLLARRKELEPEARVTVTDVLVKVCAQALMRHPEVNVQFTEEALLRFPSANVALAVAAPQGLMVPVIKGAERLSLHELAAARADLVERSRAGKLRAEDLEGGTFTISNLGMFGVERFIAVLNPPQAAILAVGATEDRPVAREGAVVVRSTVTMTLTVDHRAVDGAPAADFLCTVQTLLEEPGLAL